MLLEGKTVLITGAANGNGAAIASGMANEGATVVIADIDLSAAKRLETVIRAQRGNAHAFDLDVTVAVQCTDIVKQVCETIGDIDVLVNNAGIRPRHEFASKDRDEAWRKTMDINVDGIRRMTLACIDALARRRGCVINVTSIAAFNASPNSMAYSTSKAAAQMLTKVLSMELAPLGIRVNAIAPGVFETDMTKPSREDPERRSRLLARIPMARFGKPEELVGPAVFLASNMSSYMTGAIVSVDGGYLAV